MYLTDSNKNQASLSKLVRTEVNKVLSRSFGYQDDMMKGDLMWRIHSEWQTVSPRKQILNPEYFEVNALL